MLPYSHTYSTVKYQPHHRPTRLRLLKGGAQDAVYEYAVQLGGRLAEPAREREARRQSFIRDHEQPPRRPPPRRSVPARRRAAASRAQLQQLSTADLQQQSYSSSMDMFEQPTPEQPTADSRTMFQRRFKPFVASMLDTHVRKTPSWPRSWANLSLL